MDESPRDPTNPQRPAPACCHGGVGGGGGEVYFSGTVLGSPKLTQAEEAGRQESNKEVSIDPQGTVSTFPNQVLGVGLESIQPSWPRANISRPPSALRPLPVIFPTRSLLAVFPGLLFQFRGPLCVLNFKETLSPQVQCYITSWTLQMALLKGVCSNEGGPGRFFVIPRPLWSNKIALGVWIKLLSINPEIF